MVEPLSAVSAVISLIDVSIKGANAAYQHCRAFKSNKDTLDHLLHGYQALRTSVEDVQADPRINTPVWMDALASMRRYFTSAATDLDKINGTSLRDNARRLAKPREVEGILNNLVCRLRHVEVLVVNLDGFSNVSNLVHGMNNMLATIQHSLGAIGGQVGDGLHVKLNQIERLVHSLPSGHEAITLPSDLLRYLFDQVKTIRENRGGGANPEIPSGLLATTASSPVGSSIGSSNDTSHSKSRSPLDQDALTARYEQVEPQIMRFITALQKGTMSSDAKGKVVQAMRQLLEPWKVDPQRVRYHLHREIGAGGYGRVYKGKLDGCAVAVKVVSADLVSGRDKLKADFLREASLMLEMRHPCIVEFRGAYWPDDEVLARNGGSHVGPDFISDDDDDEDAEDGIPPATAGGFPSRVTGEADPSRAFILTELMHCNLQVARAQRGLRSPREKRRVLCDVAEALYFMHSRGVVHMDVKAENVLLRFDKHSRRLDGRAKLTDFGVSRKKRDTLSARRSRTTGLAAGTRLFMSPELLLGECGAQKACDVWSFGALMCSVLSLMACPTRRHSDLLLVQAASAHTLHEEMALWARSISNGRLRSLALRCLSDKPEDRPSFADVLAVLEWEDEDVTQMLRQAVCFLNGSDGVCKDDTKAVKLLKRACDAGDSSAMCNLGVYYETCSGLEKNETKAVEWYTRAAESGEALAMLNLGICYAQGRGVAKNEATAVELFGLASEAGVARAVFNLGTCFLNGSGVEKDHAKAVELYKRAADAGEALAMLNFGMCYANGIGVERDDVKAAELFSSAVDAGDAQAMFILAVCYEKGTGVEQDDAKATGFYQRSADAGNPNALAALGWDNVNGSDSGNDDPEEGGDDDFNPVVTYG
jgi:TPR repeat protein